MWKNKKSMIAAFLCICMAFEPLQIITYAGENTYEIAEENASENIEDEVVHYASDAAWEDGDRVKTQAGSLLEESEFPGFQLYSRKLVNKYTGLTYTHNSIFDKCTVVNGIDVSVWQGNINWQKVKDAGIEFAIIRVGCRGVETGEIYEDDLYKQNIKGAIAAGIKVGVYIYSQAITRNEAIAEANFVLKRIKPYNITLPVVIDYEYYDGPGGRLYDAHLSPATATSICAAFCDTVKNAGYSPMIYANASMLSNQLQASVLDRKYQIWLASWGESTNYPGNYDYWQYSSYGTVNGISGRVDCNFWYNPVRSTSLKLSAKSKTLNVGDSVKLTGTISPSNSTDIITWTSSNRNVAYIDQSGNLMAAYRGSTVITATTTSGVSATCKVTVYDDMSNYEIAPITSVYTYNGSKITPEVSLRTRETVPLTGTVNTALNLRTGPSQSYSIIATMPVGTDVTIYKPFKNGNSTWYSIKASMNGKTYRGYCAAAYVDAKLGKRTISDSYYSVSYQNNVNAGTARAVATGLLSGYLKSSVSEPFTIAPRSIGQVSFADINGEQYTGSPVTPDVSGTYNGMKLLKGRDYTLTYENNVGSGNATAVIHGTGNYTGQTKKSFRIWGSRRYSIETVPNQVYTGSPLTPDIVLRDLDTGALLTDEDYKVTYQNNTNPGTATAIVQGIGKYDGNVQVQFQIVSSESGTKGAGITVENIGNQEYTGEKIAPKIKVMAGGKILSDSDYEVVYENNRDCGTAVATVTAKGNYTGTVVISFEILQSDIASDFYFTNKVSDVTYSGKAYVPQIILENGYGSLVQNKDYTISYSNNINAGTAVITLKGIGSYCGMRTVTFKINRKSIAGISVGNIPYQVYTGAAITPEAVLYNDSLRLTKNKDYTLSYSGNVNKGTAKITIAGKGNYMGTKVKTFVIQPRSLGSCTIGKISDRQYTGKAITPSLSVKYGARKLIKNRDYTVKYTSNQKIGTASITVFGTGNFTGSRNISFSILPKKITGIGTKKTTKSFIYLKWGKSSNCTGYEVWRATAYDGTYKKIRTLKSPSANSYQNKGLSAGKEYYYKVRAYKTVNGKKYSGPFSGVLSRTTKISSTQYGIAKSALRLRKHAGTSYGDVIRISKGSQVTIVAKTYDKKGGTWYKVRYKKSRKTYTGYIKTGWVTVEKAGVVKADLLTLRKRASTASTPLTYLYNGKTIRILGTKTVSGRKWYRVRAVKGHRTYTGYVMGRYVKLK